MNVRDHIKSYKFYDGIKEHKKLSASQLSRDVLELYLAATEEPKPGTFGKGSIGSIFHMGMETVFKNHVRVKAAEWVQEKRFTKKIRGYKIDGKMDMIDFRNHVIFDWKGMSASAYATFKRNDKHAKINVQMAVYNWLLGGDFTAEAHCFITNWDPVVPSHPASAYQIVQCKIMTIEETEAYITAKIDKLEYWLDGRKAPPVCEDVMPRFVKEGVYIDSKCAYYCDYSHVCNRKADKVAVGLGLKWGRK